MYKKNKNNLIKRPSKKKKKNILSVNVLNIDIKQLIFFFLIFLYRNTTFFHWNT